MTTQPIAPSAGPAVLQISASAPPEMQQMWQSICRTMEPLIKEQARNVQRCHQIGEQAALIKQHELHRHFGFSSYEDLCHACWGLSGETVNGYVDLALGIPFHWLPEARVISLGAAEEAGRAPQAARETLFGLVLSGFRKEDITAGKLAAGRQPKKASDGEVRRAALLGAQRHRRAFPPGRGEKGARRGAVRGQGKAGSGLPASLHQSAEYVTDLCLEVREAYGLLRDYAQKGERTGSDQVARLRAAATDLHAVAQGLAALFPDAPPPPPIGSGAGPGADIRGTERNPDLGPPPEPEYADYRIETASTPPSAPGSARQNEAQPGEKAADSPPAQALGPEPRVTIATPRIEVISPDRLESELDRLCAGYQPVRVPNRPPVIPIPDDFYDCYGSFRLNDRLVLGATGRPTQCATIGRDAIDDFRIGFDLLEPFLMSLVGTPKSGKSMLLASLIQSMVQPLKNLNHLISPHCALVANAYSGHDDRLEPASWVYPNQDPRQVLRLLDDYCALPLGLEDVVVVAHRNNVLSLRELYPHLSFYPSAFAPEDLSLSVFQALLGVSEDNPRSLYMQLGSRLLARLQAEGRLSIAAILEALPHSQIDTQGQRKIRARLELVRDLLCQHSLRRLVRSGRVIVLYLGDDYMPMGESLALMAMMFSILGQAGECNIVAGFDEAEQYFKSEEMKLEIERMGRRRRHRGLSTILANPDPHGIPVKMLELSDHIGMGQMSSENWLNYLVKANTNLKQLKARHFTNLVPGRLWLWSQRFFSALGNKRDLPFNLIDARPLCAQHGGASRTAVR